VTKPCVICGTYDGTHSKLPTQIALKSTPSGNVCFRCINQLVADVIQMRKPWDKSEWEEEE